MYTTSKKIMIAGPGAGWFGCLEQFSNINSMRLDWRGGQSRTCSEPIGESCCGSVVTRVNVNFLMKMKSSHISKHFSVFFMTNIRLICHHHVTHVNINLMEVLILYSFGSQIILLFTVFTGVMPRIKDCRCFISSHMLVWNSAHLYLFHIINRKPQVP